MEITLWSANELRQRLDELVAAYMAIERRPLESLQQRSSELQGRLAVYQALLAKVQALQASARSLSSWAVSHWAEGGDPGAIEVEATASAVPGSYEFRVRQLATPCSLRGGELNTNPSARSAEEVAAGPATIDTSRSFAEAGFEHVPDGSVTVNGVVFQLADYGTVDEFMEAINQSADAHALIYYDPLEDRFVIQSTDGQPLTLEESGVHPFLSEARIAPGTYSGNAVGVRTDVPLEEANLDVRPSGSGSFSINGVTIQWDAAVDTLQELIDRINASGAGVRAFYDPDLDRVTFTSLQTGAGSRIAWEDLEGTLLSQTLKLQGAEQTPGQDALFTVNSTDPADEISRPTNSFELMGLRITLRGANVSDYAEAGTVVRVEVDEASLQDTLEGLIADVNAVLDYIQEQTAVDPQTHARQALSGDVAICALRRQLMSAFAERLALSGGGAMSVRDLGVSLGEDMRFGLADPARLGEALRADREGVAEFLQALGQRLQEVLRPFGGTEAEEGTLERRAEVLREHAESLEDRIEQMEAVLAKREENYRREVYRLQQSLTLLLQQQSLLASLYQGTLGWAVT